MRVVVVVGGGGGGVVGVGAGVVVLLLVLVVGRMTETLRGIEGFMFFFPRFVIINSIVKLKLLFLFFPLFFLNICCATKSDFGAGGRPAPFW